MPESRSLLRVQVKPALLRWAYERARLDPAELAQRFPRLSEWEEQQSYPTFKQLEKYAAATHTPFGYFFLPSPPAETVPIPDFRTVGDRTIEKPSPDMLDTIYLCQQRQEWYHEYARTAGDPPISFVGSAAASADVVETAAKIRETLGFDVQERERMRTWAEALHCFIEQADAAGVLVMVSGVVGNNTHRRLDPDEFRGFALCDDMAPLVFINGADTKAAQMFTLAHELAHLFLGQSALDDVQPALGSTQEIERRCNEIAAEMLVPSAALHESYTKGEDLGIALSRLARQFKVSTLVVLLRIYDAGGLTRDELRAAYREEMQRLAGIEARGSGGGNFYFTEAARVGKRFARAVVSSTLEGQTLYRDAFRLLAVSKTGTLLELGRTLGVA